jgi:hypothetical protein
VMASNKSLTERVCAFVSQQTSYPEEKVSLDTRLAWDLGLAGDDAEEFFEAFSREFAVDPTSLGTMGFEYHFGREGWGIEAVLAGVLLVPLCLLPWVWFGPYLGGLLLLSYCYRKMQERRHGRGDIPIRVRHLVDAAQAGRWLK